MAFGHSKSEDYLVLDFDKANKWRALLIKS